MVNVDQDTRVREWVDQLRPQGAVELDLVVRAATLAASLEAAARQEAVLLARRARIARKRAEARRSKTVADLGRRLFVLLDPRLAPAKALAAALDDDPACLVQRLEQTAEGRRWLRGRWDELRNLVELGLEWTRHDQFRLVRLLGRHGRDAVVDPALNAIFLAWERLQPGSGEKLWDVFRTLTPAGDPAFTGWLNWRVCTPKPPASRAEAVALLRSTIAQALQRLDALDESDRDDFNNNDFNDNNDLIAFDPGRTFDRLQRFQHARNRELIRTLDALAKLRKAQAEPASSPRKTTTKPAEQRRVRRACDDAPPADGPPKESRCVEGRTLPASPTEPDRPAANQEPTEQVSKPAPDVGQARRLMKEAFKVLLMKQLANSENSAKSPATTPAGPPASWNRASPNGRHRGQEDDG